MREPERELEQKGIKLTRQRREILSVLQDIPGMCTAEELFKRVQAVNPGVSLSTIYRNLDLLVAEGLVCKVDLGDGYARYEGRRHEGHHHHLVCTECGRSEHLDCPLPDISATVADKGFSVTGHRFVVYGRCPDCR